MEKMIVDLKKEVEMHERNGDLKDACDKALKLAKENLAIMLAVPFIFADGIALGIYPYVEVNHEELNSFFSKYDIFTDELPDLDFIKEKNFFEIDPEINKFLYKLIAREKELTIKILFAIAWLKIK